MRLASFPGVTATRAEQDVLQQQLVTLWQQGQFTECLALAQQITQRYPKAALAWKLLATLQQQQGALPAAALSWAKAAKLLKQDAEVFYNWANVCTQCNQHDEAIRHYRQAIRLNPQCLPAYANLAHVLQQHGQSKEAERLLHAALSVNLQAGLVLFELGGLLLETGRPLEAIQYYREAVALEPDNAVLAVNLGQALQRVGNLEEAASQFERATRLDATYREAWVLLANTCLLLDRLQMAEQAYQAAYALHPQDWEVLNHLAQLYKRMQRVEDYRDCVQRILQLDTPPVEQLNQFAASLINQNLLAEAERYCQQAVALTSDNPYVFCNMAVIMHHRQDYAQAVSWYEKALALKPDSAPMLSNYSVSLRMLGALPAAHEALRKALQLAPDYVDAHINLGNLYLDEGRIAEAVATFQQVLALDAGNDKAYRNLLFADSYANVLTDTQHRAYAQSFGQQLMARARPFQSWTLHPQDSRLRIGLVSADLRSHPVGYFLLQWLQHNHAGQTEIYAYSTDGKEDAFTQTLKPYCSQWRSLAGLSDERAARLIHEDGIHILLDLSGFTADSRIAIFAWKPAPVQASWLGYWDTTGVPAMDYVITDPVSAPGGQAAAFTEQLAYLPHTRLCFSAPDISIEVNALPALEHGYLTIGCFQNYSKVSATVLQLWAQVFAALPTARLRWQCKAFSDAQMQAQALDRLAAAGIARERCELVGKTSREDYLRAHHAVDLILDTAPFTGGTTTCEALWMGVPTLTLAGQSMIARQGGSMLHCAGLADWVVETEAAYVQQALAFAADLPALAALRSRLRQQLMVSPLMDGPLFAQEMTALLHGLWQQHCAALAPVLGAVQPLQAHFMTAAELPATQVWVVSATRQPADSFWQASALGISLRRQMQQDPRLVARIAYQNRRGLSEVFNEAIAQAPAGTVLVFVHDDVWLDENPFVHTLLQGLAQYDVIGLAGNQRCLPTQPAWLFADLSFSWEAPAHLLGKVAHGAHPFGPVSVYGSTQGPCQLMDGVFMAARVDTLLHHQVRFDPRFDFHFYDLDFCRTASAAGLTLGVWPVAITHQSEGAFGSEAWRTMYQHYLAKWMPDHRQGEGAAAAPLAQAVEQVFALAVQQHQVGEHMAARQLYQEILQIDPAHALTHHNLGLLDWAAGESQLAIPAFRQAFTLAPEQWQLLSSYVIALADTGECTQAEQVLQLAAGSGHAVDALQALAQQVGIVVPTSEIALESVPMQVLLQPDAAQVSALLVLFDQQHYTEMERQLQALLCTFPDWLDGWKMLSDLLMLQKRDARQPASQALALSMRDPKAHCYYGLVLKAQGELQAAADAFRQAILLQPDYAAAYNNLGIVLKDLGEVETAIAQFDQALVLQPAYADCFSNRLFCLTHAPAISPAALLQAHRDFATRFEVPLKQTWQRHHNSPQPARPLHIGFVSADFRAHSVAHFLLPLLPALAQQPSVVVHAYASNALSDEVTLQMRNHIAHWHEVSALSDQALAAQIRADGIDILIDLSGHTAGNRLLTFARKPAPVQASWLGYLNTTGLEAMDYYLADAALLPPGQYDAQFSEQLVQLPVNAAFIPFELAPAVNALPAASQGVITFGCFNRPGKITQTTVALWARLMQAVPASRMVLGGMAGDDSHQHVQQWFAEAGISADRLTFHARTEMQAYLQQYHEVDICLDTFPSSGVTTTAHGLWMGVPTLCLAGDRLASRGAMALMQHLQLDLWIAADQDAFVQQGVQLCQDLVSLAELRSGLRTQFARSSLANPEALARALVQAFQQMWQQWCAGAAPASFAIRAAESLAQPLGGAAMAGQPHTLDQRSTIEALLAQAKACQAAGEISPAVAGYQQVLALDAQHAEAHHQLGFIEVHTLGVAQAMPHLEAAVMSASGCEQYWVTYIDALLMLADFSTAETAIVYGLKYGLSAESAQQLRSEMQTSLQASGQSAGESTHYRPRITTLVPAYKPEYLAELLSALSAQTYRHFRVIVSDDSPQQQVTQLLHSPALAPLVSQLDLRIVQGPRKGTMTNIVHLLAQCDDDDGLVHVLFDDDLIYPRFYEKHVQAHQQADVGASVSYRWYCNAHGQPLGVTAVPAFVDASSTACQPLTAEQLFGSTIADCNNWLGEFSNAVFKRDAVRLYARSHMADIPYYGLGDIGVLLDIAQQQQVVLVKEYLGAFRQHDSQHSVNYGSRVFKCGLVAWVALALGAYKLGRVPATVLQGVVARMHGILSSRYADAADMQPLRQLFASEAAHTPAFEQHFRPLWASLLAGDDWLAAQALQGQQHDAMSAIPA